MNKLKFIFFKSFVFYCTLGLAQSQPDEDMIKNIYDFELTKGQSYEMLDYLSNQIGEQEISRTVNSKKVGL